MGPWCQEGGEPLFQTTEAIEKQESCPRLYLKFPPKGNVCVPGNYCQGREKGWGLPRLALRVEAGAVTVASTGRHLSEAAQGPWPQGPPPAATQTASPFPRENGRRGLREQQ